VSRRPKDGGPPPWSGPPGCTCDLRTPAKDRCNRKGWLRCQGALNAQQAQIRFRELKAPGGMRVQTNVKAGGFCPWPAHSVELLSDEEGDIVATTRAAILLALGHEVDEHMKLDGKRVREPHPMKVAA